MGKKPLKMQHMDTYGNRGNIKEREEGDLVQEQSPKIRG